tara:strand:+ start:24 stop:1772 length:1749 start_codon:yes stop_codon:yes gene_type:complete
MIEKRPKLKQIFHRQFALLLLLSAISSLRGDSYATEVIHYDPGEGFATAWDTGLGYTNSVAVLGPPSRQTPGDFGGPVDPFSPPYLAEQLLSVGAGGSLTLAFETPLFDHPLNPHGLDFILFGNTGFVIINGDYSGGGITDGSMFGGGHVHAELRVSADDEVYHRINPNRLWRLGNGLPTDGIGDFTRPLDPDLQNEDFADLGYSGIRDKYQGSGGGLGIDLQWAEQIPLLPWVRYIRLDVISGRLDLDAVSIASPSASPSDQVRHASFVEDFSSDPVSEGSWKIHGDPSLFKYNEVEGRLDITWDSSEDNSFFYHPLNQTLNKDQSFALSFTLQVDQLEIGVDPEKKSTFPIALGLMELEEGLRSNYFRGSGIHEEYGPRGLVEWSYHADSGFGATVSSGFVSIDNQWSMQNTFPLELTMGAVYEIALHYDAQDQSLTTLMTEDGLPYGPIQNISLDEFYGAPLDGFTDLNVDSIVIASYSDGGQASPEFAGSVLANGWVDNMKLSVGRSHAELEIRLGDVPTEVMFDAKKNTFYWLEKTTDFKQWETRGFLFSESNAQQSIKDLGSRDAIGFYRVRALVQ